MKRFLAALGLPVRLFAVWIAFATALWISRGMGGGVVAFAVATAVACALWWRWSRPGSQARRVAHAVVTGVAMIPLAYVLVPLAPSVAAPIKPDATVETWNLRPGRDVAVYRHPRSTQAADRRLTLVFVHGGPGGYVRDFDRAFFARFARDGFDVLLYDQAGAGRSPLLDAREYTHANNVEDLRAFVARIDTPVVLVGQSYGAALVTSALADPTTRRRVAHVVLSEPGKIPGAAFSADPLLAEKTTRAADAGRPPDLATARGMMAPRAILAAILPPGQTLATQEELINHYSPALQRALVRNSFCKGHDDLLASFVPTRCQRRLKSDPLDRLIADSNLTHPGAHGLRCDRTVPALRLSFNR